jgi:hypothetical protein
MASLCTTQIGLPRHESSRGPEWCLDIDLPPYAATCRLRSREELSLMKQKSTFCRIKCLFHTTLNVYFIHQYNIFKER